MFGLFKANFSCYLGFHLGLGMCWDVRLSSSYDVLSLRSKMGLPFIFLEVSPCFIVGKETSLFYFFEKNYDFDQKL